MRKLHVLIKILPGLTLQHYSVFSTNTNFTDLVKFNSHGKSSRLSVIDIWIQGDNNVKSCDIFHVKLKYYLQKPLALRCDIPNTLQNLLFPFFIGNDIDFNLLVG